MSLQRRAVRNAIVSKLKGKTSCGDRVFPNRGKKIFDSEIPMILVYTLNEPAEIANESPMEFARRLNLAVHVIVKGTERMDDELDGICQEIEDLLFVDDSLNGKASRVTLTNTEFAYKGEGDQPIAGARMEFEVLYHTFAGADPDEIEPMKTAHIEFETGGDNTTAEAVDTVTLPE